MNNCIHDKEVILVEILNLLAERYPIGLYEYLYKYQLESYKRIRELEDEVDNAFLYKTVGDLKKVLREYWVIHMTCIKEFENQEDLDLEVSEVKQQIEQELHVVWVISLYW